MIENKVPLRTWPKGRFLTCGLKKVKEMLLTRKTEKAFGPKCKRKVKRKERVLQNSESPVP
jgi:hypothetical protein